MIQYIKHLESTDHVLGDWSANGAVIICPTVYTISGGAPWLFWSRGRRRAYWGWRGRGSAVGAAGGLSAVRGDLKL